MNMQEATKRRFTVTGADRNTGNEIRIAIDADSAKQAEAIVNGLGVLVASVEAEEEPNRPVARPVSAAPGKDQMICPNPNCGYRGPALVRRAIPQSLSVWMMMLGATGAFFFGAIGVSVESGREPLLALGGLCAACVPVGFVFALLSLIKQRTCPKCSMKVSY